MNQINCKLNLLSEQVEILDKALCNIIDNQKILYKKLKETLSYDDARGLVSYNDFMTCSFENDVYKKEKNEIMKIKEYTIFTDIKQINEKICKQIKIVYENGETTISENYINCNKKEFENEWEK